MKSLFAKLFLVVMSWVSMGVHAQTAEFIWSEEQLVGSQIKLSRYENGSWQAAEQVVSDKNWNILPVLGSDSKGHHIAVWSVLTGQKSTLKYSLNSNGQWQVPNILTDQMQTNLAPVVLFDNQDVCWLFWAANNGADDDIYMSKFTNEQWSTPKLVHDDNDQPDILPETGMDDVGNVWVTWQSLTDEGYIQNSKTFEHVSGRKMQGLSSMSVQQIQSLKAQSNLRNNIQPPSFFKSLGKASLHFPQDKRRPLKSVESRL